MKIDAGMMVIIWAGLVVFLQCIILWMGWKQDTDLQTFKSKVIKILREHDATLYPPKIKTKGKVIPYVGPIGKNK
jgi:hypothetical protein